MSWLAFAEARSTPRSDKQAQLKCRRGVAACFARVAQFLIFHHGTHSGWEAPRRRNTHAHLPTHISSGMVLAKRCPDKPCARLLNFKVGAARSPQTDHEPLNSPPARMPQRPRSQARRLVRCRLVGHGLDREEPALPADGVALLRNHRGGCATAMPSSEGRRGDAPSKLGSCLGSRVSASAAAARTDAASESCCPGGRAPMSSTPMGCRTARGPVHGPWSRACDERGARAA